MANYTKIKRWYNKQYKARGESFGVPVSAYYITLRNFLFPGTNPVKILDVACGQGYALEVLDNYAFSNNIPHELYGVDVSEEAIKLTNKNCPKAITQEAPAERLPFNNQTIDYLICIGSLEHFISQRVALQEMQRVGRYSCRYLILVPNKWSIFRNKTEQKEINEHMRSIFGWEKLISKYFNIKEIRKDSWHIVKENSAFKKFLLKITPMMFFHSFVFILERK